MLQLLIETQQFRFKYINFIFGYFFLLISNLYTVYKFIYINKSVIKMCLNSIVTTKDNKTNVKLKFSNVKLAAEEANEANVKPAHF